MAPRFIRREQRQRVKKATRCKHGKSEGHNKFGGWMLKQLPGAAAIDACGWSSITDWHVCLRCISWSCSSSFPSIHYSCLTFFLSHKHSPWSLVHTINPLSVSSSSSSSSFSWPETWRGRQEEPVPAGVSGARAEAPPAPAGAAEGRQRRFSPEQPGWGGEDTHGQCGLHPLLRPLWLRPRWVGPRSLNMILILPLQRHKTLQLLSG